MATVSTKLVVQVDGLPALRAEASLSVAGQYMMVSPGGNGRFYLRIYIISGNWKIFQFLENSRGFDDQLSALLFIDFRWHLAGFMVKIQGTNLTEIGFLTLFQLTAPIRRVSGRLWRLCQ
jgi:hypothetical protein